MGIVVSDATMASAMDALDAAPPRVPRDDAAAFRARSADDRGNGNQRGRTSTPLIAGASSHAETNAPTPIAAQSNG